MQWILVEDESGGAENSRRDGGREGEREGERRKRVGERLLYVGGGRRKRRSDDREECQII